MTLGLGSVNLEQAVRDAGVPRSSAYAIWSKDKSLSPQQVFQRAVLHRSAEERRENVDQLRSRAAEIASGTLDGQSPKKVFEAVVQEMSEANFSHISASPSWSIVTAIRAILNSGPAEKRDQEVLEWIDVSEAQKRERVIEEVFRPLVEFFGLRPREGFGDAAFHYTQIAGAALGEGLAIRTPLQAGEYLEGLSHPDHPSEERWSLYGLMSQWIVMKFFEPIDPEVWDPDGT